MRNDTHFLTRLISKTHFWLGWRDSNPRMPGPKPGALPLGDIPSIPEMKSRFVNL